MPGMVQLDTENADRDITSLITVLTDTPDASRNTHCQALVTDSDFNATAITWLRHWRAISAASRRSDDSGIDLHLSPG